MNDRQLAILGAVIQEYVRTAEPVASKAVAEVMDVSPATIRNDMAMLEEEGFLRQPHTSAGRVPTEEGYRLFLERFVKPREPGRVSAPLRKAITPGEDSQDRLRAIAKSLVELSGDAALTSLDAGWNYYTGLSKLLDKPEFADVQVLRAFSGAVDRMDEVMQGAFAKSDRDMNVWIGSENPFGHDLATILVRYKLPGGGMGILGLVGPLRMDYKRNIELLEEAKTLLDDQSDL